MQNQLTSLTELITKFVNSNSASTSSSGTLPSNTIVIPRSDLKAITTQSGVSYYVPQIPPLTSFLPQVVENKPEARMDTVNPTNNGSTEDVQPWVVQSETLILTSEPVTSPIRAYFDADPRVPLILRRSFIKTKRALIDVFEEAFLNDDPSLPPPNQGKVCPHHGFSELHQLDTFYNALNVNDQDSLNSAVGGNFLDKIPRECLKIIESKSKVCQSRAKAVIAKVEKMPRECLAIIENKSKVRYSRNKPVVAKVSMNTSTSGISPDVAELKDMVKALLFDKKSQNQAPTTIKARFDESFSEAWDRFKDLLKACPHHGFLELQQLDTFYIALNLKEQDSLNSVAGGNF
nr:reverse transcriptase domain-containing protein [Tanacetum cinerariifolium]